MMIYPHLQSIRFYKLIHGISKVIYLFCVRPNSCNSQKKHFFIFWANVVLSVFPRAKNRALDRALWCSPSCKKSCFLVLSLVPRIVLFGAFPRDKNRARDCAFLDLFGAFLRALLSFVQTSCSRSCFLVLSFVHKIVL